MFSQTIRYIAFCLIGVATLLLALGVMLFQAAFATGADSNYRVAVSWFSALSSVIWQPSWRLFLLLLGVFLLASFTLLLFFRAPRGIGVAALFLQAGLAVFGGGGIGLFFIIREFETYHFSMDAEKLGEHWFSFEAIAVWALTAAVLGFIRIFARKQPVESGSQGRYRRSYR